MVDAKETGARAAPRASGRTRSLSSPPPAGPPPVARLFAVHCTRCGSSFFVDRAPARCARCGGIAVAGSTPRAAEKRHG